MLDLFSTKIAYGATEGVTNFVKKVDALIINPIIYVMFAVAILIFLYGVLEFMMNQASDEKKTTGKSHMIWGVVGITIMLGVWTILGFVLNTLGIKGINPQQGTVELKK